MSDFLVPLFRAVRPEELASIMLLNRFTNPPDVLTKYFAASRDQAERYGRLAQAAFEDGPYAIVETAIAAGQIDWAFRANVESGVAAVVLPTQYLRQLEPPRFLGTIDETG